MTDDELGYPYSKTHPRDLDSLLASVHDVVTECTGEKEGHGNIGSELC